MLTLLFGSFCWIELLTLLHLFSLSASFYTTSRAKTLFEYCTKDLCPARIPTGALQCVECVCVVSVGFQFALQCFRDRSNIT